MKPFTLHLVRHGESEWNAAGRVQGQSNSNLSDLGQRQAEATGKALVNKPLSALYASDLDRAQQTAAQIRAHTDLDVQTDPRLRETDFGDWEGLRWTEIETQYATELTAIGGEGGHKIVIPGGESRAQTLERAKDVLSSLADKHAGEQIVAVSHGGLIAYFLRYVLGMSLDGRGPFKTENCSINTFERTSKGWRLITWGAVAHLDGLDPA